MSKLKKSDTSEDPCGQDHEVTCLRINERFVTVATGTKPGEGTLMSESNQSEFSLAVDAAPESPRSPNHEVTCVGNSDSFVTLANETEQPEYGMRISDKNDTYLPDEAISLGQHTLDQEVTCEGSVDSVNSVAIETERVDETYRKETPENLSILDVKNPVGQEVPTTEYTAAQSMQTSQTPERPDEIGTDAKPFDIRPPGQGWRFNVFLDKISESLDDTEFKRLKSFFRHADGLGKAVIERMDHPLDLFNVLKEMGFIHFNDLAHLQGGLYHLKRIDLVKKCVEYARETPGTIYIYSNKYEPENGYKFVKFHIAGRDFLKKTNDVLKRLKFIISDLLCIPLEYIFIVGVDNTQSLLVTVMMREDYSILLEKILNDRKMHSMLWDLHIDMIHVENRTFWIEGDNIEEIDQEPQVSTIYQQLEDTRKQLHRAEVALLEQSQRTKLDVKENYEWEKKTMLEMMKNLSSSYGVELHLESERNRQFEEFYDLLHEVKHNCNPDLVRRLIDLNTIIHQWFVKEDLRLKIGELTMKNQSLQRALSKERYDGQTFRLLTRANAEDSAASDGSAPIRNDILQCLEELSEDLNDNDRKRIRAMYEWKPGSISTDLANSDRQFLHGIFTKEREIRSINSLEDLEQFLCGLFEQVDKPSLNKKYSELLRKHNIKYQKGPAPLGNDILLCLEELSGQLSESEREQIRALYEWQHGNVSTTLAHTDRQFLHGIVTKEWDKRQLNTPEDLEHFLFRLFEHVGNTSLKTKYLEIVRKSNLQSIDYTKLMETHLRCLSEDKTIMANLGNAVADITPEIFLKVLKLFIKQKQAVS